jgi:uncharacterized protein YqeY
MIRARATKRSPRMIASAIDGKYVSERKGSLDQNEVLSVIGH